MTYLLIITFVLCSIYFFLFCFLPIFFGKEMDKISKKAVSSVIIILAVSFFVYYLSFTISNIEIANRILHIFGGGFLAFWVCFLAVYDGRLKINKFQFFIFTILFVTALGVLNEIIEFFLQNYAHMMMAPDINDTWLDLISNTIGLIFASLIFVPFVNRQKIK
jgi:hypothetical protein